MGVGPDGGCGGSSGGHLHEVNVFSCTPSVRDVSIAGATVVEGSGRDVTNALFRVTLSRPAIRPIAVGYEVIDGTAQHGNDFPPGLAELAGTLVIPAGATSGTIPVLIKSDPDPEPDETFTVRIAVDPAVATLVQGTATGTILNDD